MSDINNDDIKEEPTEQQDDQDAGGHGAKDSGDEPTERTDDLDAGGEGNQDTGDN